MEDKSGEIYFEKINYALTKVNVSFKYSTCEISNSILLSVGIVLLLQKNDALQKKFGVYSSHFFYNYFYNLFFQIIKRVICILVFE